MESLQIKTGQISLNILDDSGEQRGVFKFNPNDVESAKRVMSLQQELAEKQDEFNKRAEAATTVEEKMDLLDESVTYFRGIVDDIFGSGSSQILFGDAKSLTMFDDFFVGILPYYQKASNERMAKYSKKSGK